MEGNAGRIDHSGRIAVGPVAVSPGVARPAGSRDAARVPGVLAWILPASLIPPETAGERPVVEDRVIDVTTGAGR